MPGTIKLILTSALAIPFLLSTSVVHAADGIGSGFYRTASTGGNLASIVDFSGNIGGASGKARRAIGRFGTRTKVELSYRKHEVDEIFFPGDGPAAEINANWDSSSTTVFANDLIDLPPLSLPVASFAAVEPGIRR